MAVPSLQHALRGNAKDVNTLLSLGISYRGSGKHVAALKTFAHIVEIDSSNWIARYQAADVQRSIGLLDAAVEELEQIARERPAEYGVLITLAETLFVRVRTHIRSGFHDRAVDGILAALDWSLRLIEHDRTIRVAWKIVSDCAYELGRMFKLDSDHVNAVRSAFDKIKRHLEASQLDSKLTEIASPFTISEIKAVSTDDFAYFCRYFAVLSYKMRLVHEPADSFSLASAWMDLGVAFFRATPASESAEAKTARLHASIQCLREAIRRDPRHSIFWSALGVVAFDLSPRLAQHAFIRAIEYNQRVSL